MKVSLRNVCAVAFVLYASDLDAQGAAIDQRLVRVRDHYDSAFAALIAAVDTTNAQLRVLRSLARFKSQHVAWAGEREGSLYALAPARARAWLVAVPPEDPALARMGSILERDDGATVPAVRVKPDLIAPAWAAVFLTCELSGLADDVLGVMPAKPTAADFLASSLRAYELEYLASLVAGGPLYAAHLDSIIVVAAPAHVVSLAEQVPALLRAHFAALDAHFGAIAPLSRREEERRAGVFGVSLLLRYSAAHGGAAEEIGRALHCIGGCPAR